MPKIEKKSCGRFLSVDELRALLSQAALASSFCGFEDYAAAASSRQGGIEPCGGVRAEFCDNGVEGTAGRSLECARSGKVFARARAGEKSIPRGMHRHGTHR